MNEKPFYIKTVIHSQSDSCVTEYQIVNYKTEQILATTFDPVLADIILKSFKTHLFG